MTKSPCLILVYRNATFYRVSIVEIRDKLAQAIPALAFSTHLITDSTNANNQEITIPIFASSIIIFVATDIVTKEARAQLLPPLAPFITTKLPGGLILPKKNTYMPKGIELISNSLQVELVGSYQSDSGQTKLINSAINATKQLIDTIEMLN